MGSALGHSYQLGAEKSGAERKTLITLQVDVFISGSTGFF
jgi:hypothetical protein